MIPYPGESLTVRTAVDVGGVGTALRDSIRYRAGSATLAAGDEWTAWVSSGWADYLDDDTTPLDVSWVVEVLSGSVTVTASEGITATRGGSDPTPTGLGSHTLTVGTNVIPSTFTATDILHATSNLMLRLEATSGPADVQQVKMRAWPTAGVVGAWSDPLPAYTREAVPNVRRLSDRRLLTGSIGEVQAHADELVSISTVLGSATGQVTVRTLGDPLGAQLQFHAFIYERDTADAYTPDIDSTLGLVDGVDYIRHPEEVSGDPAGTVDPLGSVTVDGWVNDTLQTEVAGVSGGVATFAALPYAGPDSPLEIAWPDTSAAPSVTIPDVDRFVLASSHSWMVDASGFGPDIIEDTLFILGNGLYDFALGGGPDYVGLRSLVTFPAYRVWSPTAAPAAQPLRLMQRGDGLGMGSGRVFGVGTRQSSTRVFGSL